MVFQKIIASIHWELLFSGICVALLSAMIRVTLSRSIRTKKYVIRSSDNQVISNISISYGEDITTSIKAGINNSRKLEDIEKNLFKKAKWNFKSKNLIFISFNFIVLFSIYYIYNYLGGMSFNNVIFLAIGTILFLTNTILMCNNIIFSKLIKAKFNINKLGLSCIFIGLLIFSFNCFHQKQYVNSLINVTHNTVSSYLPINTENIHLESNIEIFKRDSIDVNSILRKIDIQINGRTNFSNSKNLYKSIFNYIKSSPIEIEINNQKKDYFFSKTITIEGITISAILNESRTIFISDPKLGDSNLPPINSDSAWYHRRACDIRFRIISYFDKKNISENKQKYGIKLMQLTNNNELYENFLGLRSGDILIGINDFVLNQRILTLRKIINSIHNEFKGKTTSKVDLLLIRDGKYIKKHFTYFEEKKLAFLNF